MIGEREMSKVITATKAAELIRDGQTIAGTTIGISTWPEEIVIAIKERFLATGHPKNITVVHGSGSGDWTGRGTHHLGYEGLTKRLICAHTGSAPRMAKLVEEDKAECYILPQGVIIHLYRAMAGKKPYLSKVGLGTFVDPRIEGGRANPSAKDALVKVVELDGEEYLQYKHIPIDVAILKGSVADEHGNLTMEREVVLMEGLPLAQAVKNNGGIVIVQAEFLARAGSLHPQKVKIPGALVDYIVLARPENHQMTQKTYYNPAFSGDIRVPDKEIPVMSLSERKIIARRATMELKKGVVTNLGIGMPEGVSLVAAEEGVADTMTLTVEAGIFGGVPQGGLDFIAAVNHEAVIDHPAMFDYYDGGGLDITFLGMAQVDQDGNCNVSKFGPRIMGCGGFINISQNTKKVVFCGTFTNGAQYKFENGQLLIAKEGKTQKFINAVDQITFSGKYARSVDQLVYYITERAVFKLEKEGMVLIEIAPGIDLQRDVLDQMGFQPIISEKIKTMPMEIFREKWGRLKTILESHYSQLPN
jgi:propionate CoA-transferase